MVKPVVCVEPIVNLRAPHLLGEVIPEPLSFALVAIGPKRDASFTLNLKVARWRIFAPAQPVADMTFKNPVSLLHHVYTWLVPAFLEERPIFTSDPSGLRKVFNWWQPVDVAVEESSIGLPEGQFGAFKKWLISPRHVGTEVLRAGGAEEYIGEFLGKRFHEVTVRSSLLRHATLGALAAQKAISPSV